MATKQKLIELFESSKGVYFSGEEIAGQLGISRAAVWKNIKALQNEGYSIDAVTNKGYCLSEKTDILSPQGIAKYLQKECKNMDITVLQMVTSTNALLREKAVQGALEGSVIIANEQTLGRGRRGRSFASPSGTGIYMSLLLRPNEMKAEQAVRITTIAAVAVCEAIEEVSGEPAQIKWVNDIFMNGKKVCGILTEASLDMESGLLDYAILGIGINVYQPQNGFPEELNNIAGTVFDLPQNDAKNHLAAEIISRFMNYYNHMEQIDYAAKYRSKSLAIGKQVNVLSGNDSRKALVLDVDDECRLLVRYEDNTEGLLSSGEISIRV